MVISITPARLSSVAPTDALAYRDTAWGSPASHNLWMTLTGPTFSGEFNGAQGTEQIIASGVVQAGWTATLVSHGGSDYEYTNITRTGGWPSTARAIEWSLNYVVPGGGATETIVINGTPHMLSATAGQTANQRRDAWITYINSLGIGSLTVVRANENISGYGVGAIILLMGAGLTSLSYSGSAFATDRTAPIRLTTLNSSLTPQQLYVVAAAPPPDITTSALDDAEVGVPYSFTVAAVDGTAPYSWGATGLPAGLSIDAGTGEISGTPSDTPGTYPVEITVTDDVGNDDVETIDLVLLAAVDITNAPAAGEVGQVYSSTLTASGGATPYAWGITLGALPLGLTLDGATGAITGTPYVAGDFEVQFTVTDALGGLDFIDATITIEALDEQPRVVRAVGLGRDRVRVEFDRPMRASTIPALSAPAAYGLTTPFGAVARTIIGATPSALVGATSVVVRFSGPLSVGFEYGITVDEALESTAGLPMDPMGLTGLWTVEALAAHQEPGQQLIVIVEIEGIGDHRGPFRFCSRRPRRYTDYSSRGGDQVYLPDLYDWPSVVEQRQHPLGGVAESGEVTVAIVDAGPTGERLTQLLAIHRRAFNYLAATVERGDTEATFATNNGLVEDRIIYVGGEAWRIGANTAGTTWEIERAQLDTAAQRHPAGAPALLGTPILAGRRIRIFIGYNDGRHSSADEDEIESGWAVDAISFTADLGAWVFKARSQLKYLDKLLDRTPFNATLETFDDQHARVTLKPIKGQPFGGYRVHFGDRVFIRIGDDECRQMTPAGLLDRNAVAGTRKGDWSEGDPVRQVFVARADQTGVDYGSFRYQAPSAETDSRVTGTWVPDAHVIVILLCLLTGKNDVDDNAPDNYVPGSGNFSALPPGVGLGMPAAEINFGSFLDVWHRAPELVLEHFVLDKTETGRKAIDRLLQLTGVELRMVDGLLECDYTRTPLADDVVATWGIGQLVARDDGNGVLRPTVGARLDASLAIGAIQFTARNARGDDVELVYSDADFPEVFGDVRGLYSVDEKPLEIEASAVRCEDGGGAPQILPMRALQVMRNYRRVPMRLDLVTPRSERGIRAGQLVRLTYPQLPDLVNGQRGVVDMPIKILSKREVVSRQAVEVQWDAISYPAGRAGRIAPAARISGPMVDGIVPVAANRYTDPQARGGLPSSDAAAFEPGYRVCLKTRGGLRAATTPAYQTVLSVGPNQLELDGDFGGAVELSAGYILAFVDHDEAATRQRDRFVFMADRTDRTVGTSEETPWTYGEG